MRILESERRLRNDRDKLLASLRDLKAGKVHHLTPQERDSLIGAIKRRLAEIDEKLRTAAK